MDAIRRDLWRRIDHYERYCSEFRSSRGMRPFCWALETREAVVSCFRDYYGRPCVPASPEAVAARRDAYYSTEAANPYFGPFFVTSTYPAPVDWRATFGLSDEQAERLIYDVLHTWNVS